MRFIDYDHFVHHVITKTEVAIIKQSMKKINYVPSLIKFYNEKYDNFEYFLTKVEKKHKSKFSRKDIKKIYNLFIEWDKKIKLSEKFNTNFQ